MKKRRSLVLGPEDHREQKVSKAVALPAPDPLPQEIPPEFVIGKPTGQAVPVQVEFMTVLGFVRMNNLNVPSDKLSYCGKEMARYCRENNLPIQPVPDPRWGKVNAYPVSALKKCFGIE